MFAPKMPLLQLICALLFTTAASSVTASSRANSNGRARRRSSRRRLEEDTGARLDPDLAIDMARQSIKFQRCYALNYAEAEEPEWPYEEEKEEEEVHDGIGDGYFPVPIPAEAARPDPVPLRYRPVWFNRIDGWNGQTYIEAVKFCEEKLAGLCPYEAICPEGMRTEPVDGYRNEEPSGSYVPVIDRDNTWVTVSGANGLEDSCIVSNPEWGMEGEGNEEMTRHVACCQTVQEPQAAEEAEGWGGPWAGGLHEGDEDEQQKEELEVEELELFAELDEEENMDEEAGDGQQQGGGIRKRMRKGTRMRRLDQDELDELDSIKYVTFRTCYDTSTCDESCNRAYGEYTMDMETYLDVTLSYMQEVQQGSCNLCDECVDLFWNEGVDGPKFSINCQNVDITTCRDGCLNLENMEADNLIDASELIECQLIQDDETTNEILYSGATCSSDGRRIEIGVFRDEFCIDRDYSKDIRNYLMNDAGNMMRLNENLLRQTYQPGCVASCLSENSVEVNMNNNQNQNYYNNNANWNQGAAPNNANWNQGAALVAEPEINEVCEDLHQFSSLTGLQNDYNYDDDMAIWEEETVSDMELPDLAKYSIKFESCNEERFEEEEAITDIYGNVEDGEVKAPMIGIQSTVSFRFCPNDSLYPDCDETCASGFGTMDIAMKTYLAVTLEYLREAQFQYCEECSECTTLGESGSGATSLRKCADIDTIECNAECADIENMEENGSIDASSYVGCRMIHRENNEDYYAGPKCSAGGRQIEIGVFLDADCTFPDVTKNVEAYLLAEDGSQMKLSYNLFNTVTGAAGLSSIRPNCHVAQCLEEDGRFNQNQDFAFNSNEQESAIESGYRINKICEVLYQESLHMGFDHDDHDDHDEYYYGEDGDSVDYAMAIDYKERDYNALALFYRMTRGQSWERNEFWLDDDTSMCDWYGVGCNEGGSVTSLELSNNSIQGSFGHSISQLANLTTLDLSKNGIVGVLGEEIGDLQRLTHLKLGSNRMRGRIPSSLSRLLQLETLELQRNQFSGFPMEEFSRASIVNLTRVDLSSNSIMGPLPHQAFSEHPKLSYLNISRNNFVGTIGAGIMEASLGSPLLKDPVVLDLSFNNFEGMVPDFENDRLTLNVVGNRLAGIEEVACGRQWNDGTTAKYKCDGIACPIGTSNSEGRQTSEDNPCVPCDVAKYVGNVGCEEVKEGNPFDQYSEWPTKPPQPPQPVRVNYELWISPADAASRDFLLNFRETALELQGYTYFTPRFFLFDCTEGEGDAENSCDSSCTNGGHYCATEPDDAFGGGISGADVVRESYRWLCIIEATWSVDGARTKWWDYVDFFLNECATTGFFADEQCVLDAMLEAGIDPELVTEKMEDFGGLDDDENKLLEEQLYLRQDHDVTTVPTLIVNRIPLIGQLNPSNAFGAICAGFTASTIRPGVCPPAPTNSEDFSDKFNMGSGSSSQAYNQSLTWGSQSNMTSFNSTGNYSTYNTTASNNKASEPSSSPFSEPSQAPSKMPVVAPTLAPTEFDDDLAPDNAGGSTVLFWQSSLLLLTSTLFL